MFAPKYVITHFLLENIKRSYSIAQELNQRRFSQPVLFELQRNAEAVSAFASTSIEGNPLPLTDVKRILKNRPVNIRQSEREVLNYNEVLQNLNQTLAQGQVAFDLKLILSIQRGITLKLLPAFQSGKLRRDPVFVNDPRQGMTVYWPPDAGDVPGLMNALVQFVQEHKNEIDPLILAGLFHKQMVIIHPFMDGNGRTTRLATKILLADMGLNTFNLFSFENYYNQNVPRYFDKVGVRGNYYDICNQVDFTEWLEYFTEGIVDELLRVKKILLETSTPPMTALREHHQKILIAIREKGFITDQVYSTLVDRAKATRRLDFNKLIEMGLIVRKGKGKNTYYELSEINR